MLVLFLEVDGLAVNLRRAVVCGRLVTVHLRSPRGRRLVRRLLRLSLHLEGVLLAVSSPLRALTFASLLLVWFLVRWRLTFPLHDQAISWTGRLK